MKTEKSNAGAKKVSSNFFDALNSSGEDILRQCKCLHIHNLSASLFIFSKKDARSWGGDLTSVPSHGSSYALYQMGSHSENTISGYL